MKRTNADFFVDSNIVLYAFDNATFKKKIVFDLIKKKPIISTQVIMESVNICIRRFKFPKEVAYQNGINLIDTCSLKLIDETTLLSTFKISLRYQFSHWDSLIISSALQNNCSILFSEDLQDGQMIEKKLIIINPFLEKNSDYL
jgi:predicted nucleic acid-binding protein